MILALREIEKEILSSIPEFESSEILVRLNESGQVVGSLGEKNEYKNYGLTDQKGNYFYLRDKDSGETKISDSDYPKTTSRSLNKNIRNEYLFVCVIKKINEEEFKSKILSCFFKSSVSKELLCSYKNFNLEVVEVITDSDKVLKNEGFEERQRDSDLFFVSVEFAITYTKDVGLENFCNIC